MYQVILFDLDGTLTDPGEGITNSVAYSLEKFGLYEPDRTRLYRFIGPPLMDSYMSFYGFSRPQAEQAVAFYREYFRDRGIFENVPYPGVETTLAALRDAGRILAVATSKPEEYAVRILEHFGLSGYFHRIFGASMDSSRSKKADVIAYALQELGVSAGENGVMVGDREYDVLGARAVGLDCVGVLFGYGSRQELEQAGAVGLATDMAELRALLLDASPR